MSLRARAAVALFGSFTALAACSVPFGAEQLAVVNSCETDAECSGGACVETSAGRLCAATQVDLGAVLLEVRSPAGLAGTTTSFVFSGAADLSGARADGAVLDVALDVPQLVEVTGRFRHPDGEISGCTAVDGSLPVRVELRPVSAYIGLDAGALTATSELAPDGTTHRFSVSVPIGTYDVHLSPTEAPEGCTEPLPPPRLLLGVEVPASVGTIDLEPPNEAPAELSGELLVPTDRTVEGWTLEIVDPRYGLPLSPVQELHPPDAGEDFVRIAEPATTTLRYSFTQSAVLRVRDAQGALAVHWSLAAVDLDGDGSIELDLRDLLANPKSLVATVLDDASRPIPAAGVTIQSVSLTGGANQNASFRVLAESDAEGLVHVDLVPGTYAVSVVPTNGSAATLSTDWVVTESSQCCGKTFELPRRSGLRGALLRPDGTTLAEAPVVVSPSLPAPTPYFTEALSAPALLPRASNVSSELDGAFELLVDPGTLDVSVRNDATSGFPWLVVPRLLVQGIDTQPQVDLGTLSVSLPAIVQGTVRSGGVVVPDATIRAWLPIEPLGDDASTPLLQIGEAIADGSGRFVLPVPPSITLQPPAEAPSPPDEP